MHLHFPVFLITAAFSVLGASTSCTNPVVRKDWRSLSDEERHRFISAQQQLWKADLDPETNLSTYDRDFTLLHRKATPEAHNQPSFLPWHRRFLRDYELALREIDPTVSLPYWNWAAETRSLNASILWSADYFGGNGQGDDNCVQNGRFANWTLHLGGHMTDPNIDVVHCLRRIWDRGINTPAPEDGPGLVPNETEIQHQILASNGSYLNFRTWWENHHGQMHLGIGGFSQDRNGDMTGVANSPNEPVFWLHHTFVDKVWYDFQQSSAGARSSYGGYPSDASSLPKDDPIWSRGARFSDIMKPWNVTVESAFYADSAEYCYEYE